MALTLPEFLKKYNLVDHQLSSYNDGTIHAITEILNGHLVDSENDIILLYIGLYYDYIKKDNNAAKKYYLAAINDNNSMAMFYMGNLLF